MARERLVSGEDRNEDKEFHWGLRPRTLDEYVGQREAVELLQIAIDATKIRQEPLDHLLLHGPPGLGKCITKDSLILTENGLVEFSELLPGEMQAGESRPIEARVYGVNGLEAASHVYCSGRTETRRLTTRSGFALEGTPHHPVLVATSDGPQWKTLGELQTGDYVAVSRGAEVWGREQETLYQADGSSQRRQHSEGCVRVLHDELTRVLERPPAAVELRAAFASERGGTLTPTAQNTAHRLGLPMSDARRLPVSARYVEAGPQNARAMRFAPSLRRVVLNADMAYLLGVAVGDGHVEKGAAHPAFVLTCAETEMQGELQRVSREVFGTAPEARVYGDKAARLRFSPNQGRVLQTFGLRAVNAREKSVPRGVLSGTREAVVGFLQGLFDADGHARRDGVEFSTRSEKLAREVQLLLLNFGIVAHRKAKQIANEKMWTLFMGSRDAHWFHERVGFRLSRKRAMVPQASESGWRRSDLAPGANALLTALLRKCEPQSRAVHRAFEHAKADDRVPTRRTVARLLELLPMHAQPEHATLRALTDERFYWDRVADVQSGGAETYDFVVPGTHSFVANGIVNHNTTLAFIMAEELGREIQLTSGPALERPADVMGFLVNAKEGDIIFIDEIHRLPRIVEEFLYSAMEDWIVNFTLDKGMYSKPLPIRLEKFTIVGATTRPALLTRPLRDRFGLQQHLDFYNEADLVTIARRSAHLMKTPIELEGAHEIARRSRGTPRITNRLLRRVRDFATVRADGTITAKVAHDALRLEGIDALGLDRLDHAVMRVIKDTYNGGPVGIEALAATLNEESDTLVDVVEPYLLKIGFLARTPAGRRLTRRAYEHLGETPPRHAIGPVMSLFDEAQEAEPRLKEQHDRKLPNDEDNK